MLVQVLVNHKYMGHLIVVLYFVLGDVHAAARARAQPVPVRFGRGQHVLGHEPLRSVSASVLVVQGVLGRVGAAVRRAQQPVLGPRSGDGRRMASPHWRGNASDGRSVAVAAAALVLDRSAVGGFIFYNTNVLNDYRTSHDEEHASADYERQYKQYEHLPQPRIVGVRVDVDLFPDASRTWPCAASTGWPTARARSDRHDPRAHSARGRDPPGGVQRGRQPDACRRPSAATTSTRSRSRCRRATALQLAFDLAYDVARLREHGRPTRRWSRTAPSSTAGSCPAFGYEPRGELSEDSTRRKYGLRAQGAHAVARRRGGARQQLHLGRRRLGGLRDDGQHDRRTRSRSRRAICSASGRRAAAATSTTRWTRRSSTSSRSCRRATR